MKKQITLIIFFMFFCIFISLPVQAVKQLTLSNLEVRDTINNNVIDYIIGSREEFYLIVDIENNGDEVITSQLAFSPNIYEIMDSAGNFHPDYVEQLSPTFQLVPDKKLIGYKMRVRFRSAICELPEPKSLTIGATAVNYITGTNTITLNYAGDPNCHSLTLTNFAWSPDHPAYLLPTQKYGFSYTIRNDDPEGTIPFDGSFNISALNWNLTYRGVGCSRAGDIAQLNPGQEITLIMPQECSIMLIGVSSIIVRSEDTGDSIPIKSSLGFNYYLNMPVWRPSTTDTDNVVYAQGDTIRIRTGGVVVSNLNPGFSAWTGPLLEPIPAGSVYHIFVNSITKPWTIPKLLYEKNIPITNEISLGKYFGTSPLPPVGIDPSNYYYVGKEINFIPDLVPEGLLIQSEIIAPDVLYPEDPYNKIIINTYANPFYFYKELTPKILCDPDILGDPDCDCPKILDIIAKTLTYTCTLKRTNMVINKQYIGRFKFNDKLESNLEKSFVSIASSNALETLAPKFPASIEFPTAPMPVQNTPTQYTFNFNCDVDGDGYLADYCETDPTKIDCDDNDALVHPYNPEEPNEALELCDGIDNNCIDGIDETFKVDPYKLEQTCNVGLGMCKNSGIYVCNPTMDGTVCSIEPRIPQNEVCNGYDDDCDGLVDEGCDSDKDGYIDSTFASNQLCYGTPICADDNGINLGTCYGCAIDKLDCDDDPSGDPSDCPETTEDCALAIPDNPDMAACAICKNPGATELCGDGIDNNCDESLDEVFNLGQSCDNGLFGDCYSGGTYVCTSDMFGSECNAPYIPGSQEVCDSTIPIHDEDCDDSYNEDCSCVSGNQRHCYTGPLGTENVGLCHGLTQDCNVLTGSFPDCTINTDGQVLPADEEICNGKDNDCDGAIDEGCDDDKDGFIDFSMGGNDCDDNDPTKYPNAIERCDSKINDCNRPLLADGYDESWYHQPTPDCSEILGHSLGECGPTIGMYICNGIEKEIPDNTCADIVLQKAQSESCDDETGYDNLDQNCDGNVLDCSNTCDPDYDKYYDNTITSTMSITQKGYCALLAAVTDLSGGDCAPDDGSIHPNALESCVHIGQPSVDYNCDGEITPCCDVGCTSALAGTCNPANNKNLCDGCYYIDVSNIQEECDNKDNNCNGQIDEGVLITYYKDLDGDGYGDSNIYEESCDLISGYSLILGDCNDADDAIYPGAPELCDGKINNCNDLSALDGSGETYYEQTEISCNDGNDNDCDDAIDSADSDCTQTTCGDYEICENTEDDNCDGITDDLSIILLTNQFTGTDLPTNLDTSSSSTNSITLKVTSQSGDPIQSVPVQGVAVCVGTCDSTMLYTSSYTTNGVTFETPFGITNSTGEVAFSYTIAPEIDAILTFKSLVDINSPQEISSPPVSFSSK